MSADSVFDSVLVAGEGHGLIALEGAVANGSGAVLLFGWAIAETFPEGLFLEFEEQRTPVEILARFPRSDVERQFSSEARGRAQTLGLFGLAFVPPKRLESGRTAIALAAGAATSRNRLLYTPGIAFDHALLGHLWLLRTLPPSALERFVQAVLDPEDQRVHTLARARQRAERIGPDRVAALSVVIPIVELGLLKHTLSRLDMDSDSDCLEVVLPITRAWMLGEIRRIIRSIAPRFPVVIVWAEQEVRLGVAVSLGVEAASAAARVVVADDILPPARGWVLPLLDDLSRKPACAPCALPRFDGRFQRFRPPPLNDGDLGWPHDEVRIDLETLIEARGLSARSPGMIAINAARLQDAPLRFESFFLADYFWADLLDQVTAIRGEGDLSAGDRFVHVPMIEGHLGPPEYRLLDTYRLRQRWRANELIVQGSRTEELR